MGLMHALAANPSPLVDALAHQDEIFAGAFSVLNQAVAERAFPAASVAIVHRGRLVALKALGRLTYRIDSEQTNLEGAPPFLHSSQGASAPSLPKGDSGFDVTPETLFDIASITKVVATTAMAMLLYQRGLLDLYAPVSALVPEFLSDAAQDPRRRNVTFHMLLTHSSGLPAYEKLFLKTGNREALLHAVFTMPLTADPASRAEYSDIGFILLGIALERLAQESIDHFCQREIFAPLGMTCMTFNPPEVIHSKIPPTADDQAFRHRIIQGEVNDENASVMGGVAPHAGLFSTGADLAKYAHSLLNGGHPILRRETVALFTRRESVPTGTSRALGWDTPGAPSQSGKYFSPNSFGHLGYTGTSLWIDPDRQLAIVLLTNRTWPDSSNHRIKSIRPKFHDAVAEALRRNEQ